MYKHIIHDGVLLSFKKERNSDTRTGTEDIMLSEKVKHMKEQMCCDCTSMRPPRVVKFIETENTNSIVVPSG